MGGAGVRSAVWHRHDGELDYHSDAAPNPGRQARPALGFAAPAWALSVGTDGLAYDQGKRVDPGGHEFTHAYKYSI